MWSLSEELLYGCDSNSSLGTALLGKFQTLRSCLVTDEIPVPTATVHVRLVGIKATAELRVEKRQRKLNHPSALHILLQTRPFLLNKHPPGCCESQIHFRDA